WHGDQVEGRSIGHRQDDPDVDTAQRGGDSGSGGCAKIDASGQHGRYRLSRLYENELGFQTLFAKETFVAGDDVGHVQYASRNITYADGGESGFFGGPDDLIRCHSRQQEEK